MWGGSWGTPYDDGGREIVDYEVYYLEMSKRPASSSEAWVRSQGPPHAHHLPARPSRPDPVVL